MNVCQGPLQSLTIPHLATHVRVVPCNGSKLILHNFYTAMQMMVSGPYTVELFFIHFTPALLFSKKIPF